MLGSSLINLISECSSPAKQDLDILRVQLDTHTTVVSELEWREDI